LQLPLSWEFPAFLYTGESINNRQQLPERS
jgi:hypothetical protein